MLECTSIFWRFSFILKDHVFFFVFNMKHEKEKSISSPQIKDTIR